MKQNLICISACAFLTLGCFAGCDSTKTPTPANPAVSDPSAAATGVVSFEFIIDGETINEQADVVDGAMLESVMRELKKVDVDMSGSGTTAFVNSINGLKTSASEGWTFEIDGEWADRGVGSLELHPPATVTWKFGAYDPTDK